MMPLVASPAAVALAVSLCINAALGWLWLAARNDVAAGKARIEAVQQERDVALITAQACSDGVARLQRLAESRTREAAQARRAAQAKARQHAVRADAVLSTPPAVRGDDCASARARVRGWLKARE